MNKEYKIIGGGASVEHADTECSFCGEKIDGNSPVYLLEDENGDISEACGPCRRQQVKKELGF